MYMLTVMLRPSMRVNMITAELKMYFSFLVSPPLSSCTLARITIPMIKTTLMRYLQKNHA